jgi:hypothetical protein
MKVNRALEIVPSARSSAVLCRCKGCEWSCLVSTANYNLPVNAAIAAFRSHECDNHPSPEKVRAVVDRIFGESHGD